MAIAAVVPVLGKMAYLVVYMATGIIGFVVSRIILTVVFFLLFTPLGFLLKLTGKDFVALATEPGENGVDCPSRRS